MKTLRITSGETQVLPGLELFQFFHEAANGELTRFDGFMCCGQFGKQVGKLPQESSCHIVTASGENNSHSPSGMLVPAAARNENGAGAIAGHSAHHSAEIRFEICGHPVVGFAHCAILQRGAA